MHYLHFFSFIGFLKPLEISKKISKLFTLSFLRKEVKNYFLCPLSGREISFYRLKNAMISFGDIHIKTVLQPNYNSIDYSRVAFQSKHSFFPFRKTRLKQIHLTSNNFSIRENNSVKEEQLYDSFRFQCNPFVANLSYLKNYNYKSKTRIKHIFLQLFVKKINEFKYILKKPVTQMLTAKVLYSLSRRITHNIKNFINLLNVKILQLCIFLKEIFVLQEISIPNNVRKTDFYLLERGRKEKKTIPIDWSFFRFHKAYQALFARSLPNTMLMPFWTKKCKQYNWKLLSNKSYCDLPRETRLLANCKWQSPFLQMVLAVKPTFLTPRKNEGSLFNNCLNNFNMDNFCKPINRKLTVHLRAFFLNFKNLLVQLVLCLKKILNKLVYKWFKNYKKSLSYYEYLQKYSLFIEKQHYFYAFDTILHYL
jgi:hypothetical protein